MGTYLGKHGKLSLYCHYQLTWNRKAINFVNPRQNIFLTICTCTCHVIDVTINKYAYYQTIISTYIDNLCKIGLVYNIGRNKIKY